MCGFCNVWVFDNCVGVLVICVLEFAVFCNVFTVFLCCLDNYIHSDLFCPY